MNLWLFYISFAPKAYFIDLDDDYIWVIID